MKTVTLLLLLVSPWQPDYSKTGLPKLPSPHPCVTKCYRETPDGDQPCPKGKRCKPGKLKTCLQECKAGK